MTRPLLLDPFCCAGGAAMGYHRAGFGLVGVDIAPQPNYPFDFVQYDALEFLEELMGDGIDTDDGYLNIGNFAAVHVSPPCQRFSDLAHRNGDADKWPDLIGAVRELLIRTGLPYVIENVDKAPLIDATKLCGSTLGCVLPNGDWLQRHRLFETNWPLESPGCNHKAHAGRCLGVYGDLAVNDRCNNPNRPGHGWKAGRQNARDLMGIDWEVTDHELAEAIPPAYTEYVGRHLMAHLNERNHQLRTEDDRREDPVAAKLATTREEHP